MSGPGCPGQDALQPGGPGGQGRLTCFRMMSVACMMHLGSSPWLRARMAACSRETLRVLLQAGARRQAGETGVTSCPTTAPETPHPRHRPDHHGLLSQGELLPQGPELPCSQMTAGLGPYPQLPRPPVCPSHLLIPSLGCQPSHGVLLLPSLHPANTSASLPLLPRGAPSSELTSACPCRTWRSGKPPGGSRARRRWG